MNLRQCLYSVYSKHASYFLPSCSFSDRGLDFCFIRGLVSTWHLFLFFSIFLCEINCLSKCDYEMKELQNSPAVSCQLFFQRLLSIFSHLRFGYPCVTPHKTPRSLLHFPDTSMWTLLRSPWASHCGLFPFISDVLVNLHPGTSLPSCIFHNLSFWFPAATGMIHAR